MKWRINPLVKHKAEVIYGFKDTRFPGCGK